MPTALAYAVRLANVLLLLLLLAVPAVGLLTSESEQASAPWPAARQWNLFIRTVLLSAGASILAVVWACLVAAGLSLLTRRGGWWLLGPLLVPPYVHAYAWSYVLAPDAVVGRALQACGLAVWTFGQARTLWVWSCWLWPIPALLMLAGWRYGARQNVELAVLDAGPGRAWLRAGMPALLPFAAAGALCCFVLALTNYSVPHLYNVNVFTTDLLAAWQVGDSVPAIAVAGWPVILTALLATAACVLSLGRLGIWSAPPPTPPTRTLLRSWTSAGPVLSALIIVVAVTLIGPLVALVCQLRHLAALWQCFVGFAEPWRTSAVIVVPGVVLAWVIAAASLRRTGRRGQGGVRSAVVLFCWTVLAVVPAVVWGSATIGGYNASAVSQWLYDRAPLVVLVLGLVGRYGWVSAWTGWLTARRLDPALDEQAHLNGATGVQRWARLHVPSAAKPLAVAAILVAALAVTELPISSMLSPPGWQTLSVRTVNLMHYQRDDQVIAIALWMIILAIVAGYFVSRAARRWFE